MPEPCWDEEEVRLQPHAYNTTTQAENQPFSVGADTPLLLLADYHGDWSAYLNALYAVFLVWCGMQNANYPRPRENRSLTVAAR